MCLLKIKSYIKNNLLLLILFLVLCLIEILFVFPLMTENYIDYDSSYQYALTQHSIPEIFELLPYDYSPPFYAIALKLFTMLFGNNLATMRAFSLVAIIGMFFIAAFPVQKIFGTRSAVIALILTFFCPAIYSLTHVIRPTLFGMFFFMAAAVFMLYAYSLESKCGYICTTVFSILAMYTHNVALVGVFGGYVTVLLFSLITKDFKKTKNFFISGIICAVAYIPWLSVIFGQISSVNDYFWTSVFGFTDTLKWTFIDTIYAYGNKTTTYCLLALTFFSMILKHIKLKELNKAKRFSEVFTRVEDKKTYRDVFLLFLFIVVPILLLAAINLLLRNLASHRYYHIIGMAWIVLLGVLIARFANKIVSGLLLIVMLVNYVSMNNYTIDDLKESDIKNIVSDISEREQGGNISFLHTHEWTLGLMTYYFPEATHYVCDKTFTVLRTYDVFPSEVVDIGDISNISNYTDKVYVFTNEWKFNSDIPWFTFEQLMDDKESYSIEEIHEYKAAYCVAGNYLALAEAILK